MFGNFAKIGQTIGVSLIWRNFQTSQVLLNKSKIVRTTLHFYLFYWHAKITYLNIKLLKISCASSSGGQFSMSASYSFFKLKFGAFVC